MELANLIGYGKSVTINLQKQFLSVFFVTHPTCDHYRVVYQLIRNAH